LAMRDSFEADDVLDTSSDHDEIPPSMTGPGVGLFRRRSETANATDSVSGLVQTAQSRDQNASCGAWFSNWACVPYQAKSPLLGDRTWINWGAHDDKDMSQPGAKTGEQKCKEMCQQRMSHVITCCAYEPINGLCHPHETAEAKPDQSKKWKAAACQPART
jgi:hypothetical protein